VPADVTPVSQVGLRTYALPIWEFFFILLEERDEAMFNTYLRAFRDNLKRYHLDKLSQYFEEHYFTNHRIKQWATWYRLQMFNCEWLANTNMHTESWHNLLKTHIMDREKNARVDKLMKIIRTAENMYFWKWARTQLGVRQLADPDWLCMREESPCNSTSPVQITIAQPERTTAKVEPDVNRSADYKQKIKELMQECLTLLETKEVETPRLRAMLTQQTRMRNVLRNCSTNTVEAVHQEEPTDTAAVLDETSPRSGGTLVMLWAWPCYGEAALTHLPLSQF